MNQHNLWFPSKKERVQYTQLEGIVKEEDYEENYCS
jgi:hypothetical protein